MKRKTALFSFSIFDFFSFFILLFGYRNVNRVLADVANSADTVSFLSISGWPVIMIAIPMIHLFMITDYLRPKMFSARPFMVNTSIIALGITLFALGILISNNLRHRVEIAGYAYCPDASRTMTFSTHLVYARGEKACEAIAKEEQKAR
jgi:hypothetical protein